METKILETKWGNIDYFYLKNIVYPNGLIVLNGTIVYKEWRGKGKFKEMLKMLFSQFDEGTEVQTAIISKKMIPLFLRIGFVKTKMPIEFWGSPANTTRLWGYIYKGIENDI